MSLPNNMEGSLEDFHMHDATILRLYDMPSFGGKAWATDRRMS